ncbi:SDR family oxidoreductase [Amycolatopsis sp. CA-230715]|uniref:SDR family oxidoreductase n=1 Tax=Amycolatopsis sp. CA-230715 TaxID=2745196 RepID=UPI001C036215|nr:NAD(P)H-binding protein [Amycolatopsis sp. CA-230715]QWF80639.1 NAD(P)H azoreductase [Amycolatopsis sp. CA-230715]
MFLVAGGRGRIARAAVARLLAEGHRVRVVSRRPSEVDLEGVEVVEGDLSKADGWQQAFDGVEAALLYADPAGMESVLDSARGRIALVSALGIDEAADPIARTHLAAEAAVKERGLPWTFLRAGGLATNTLQRAPSIRAEGVVRAPFRHSHAALVHEADVAEIAVRALTTGEHDGRAYDLTGPASLTQEQQVAAIAEATGADVKFEEITPGEYRRTLSQWGDDSMVDTLLTHLRAADGVPQSIAPDFQEITGREPTSYARWAVDHADDFRQAGTPGPAV